MDVVAQKGILSKYTQVGNGYNIQEINYHPFGFNRAGYLNI